MQTTTIVGATVSTAAQPQSAEIRCGPALSPTVNSKSPAPIRGTLLRLISCPDSAAVLDNCMIAAIGNEIMPSKAKLVTHKAHQVSPAGPLWSG